MLRGKPCDGTERERGRGMLQAGTTHATHTDEQVGWTRWQKWRWRWPAVRVDHTVTLFQLQIDHKLTTG